MDEDDLGARQDSRVPRDIEELAHAVIGAAIEVHRELGPGLAESHYKLAMSHELKLRGIPHVVEAEVDVLYKGVPIGKGRIDLLVGDRLIVELKVVEALTDIHRSQAITYLKIKHLPLALLINFNTVILKDGIRRVIWTR
jgi:GxxExxY protein